MLTNPSYIQQSPQLVQAPSRVMPNETIIGQAVSADSFIPLLMERQQQRQGVKDAEQEKKIKQQQAKQAWKELEHFALYDKSKASKDFVDKDFNLSIYNCTGARRQPEKRDAALGRRLSKAMDANPYDAMSRFNAAGIGTPWQAGEELKVTTKEGYQRKLWQRFQEYVGKEHDERVRLKAAETHLNNWMQGLDVDREATGVDELLGKMPQEDQLAAAQVRAMMEHVLQGYDKDNPVAIIDELDMSEAAILPLIMEEQEGGEWVINERKLALFQRAFSALGERIKQDNGMGGWEAFQAALNKTGNNLGYGLIEALPDSWRDDVDTMPQLRATKARLEADYKALGYTKEEALKDAVAASSPITQMLNIKDKAKYNQLQKVKMAKAAAKADWQQVQDARLRVRGLLRMSSTEASGIKEDAGSLDYIARVVGKAAGGSIQYAAGPGLGFAISMQSGYSENMAINSALGLTGVERARRSFQDASIQAAAEALPFSGLWGRSLSRHVGSWVGKAGVRGAMATKLAYVTKGSIVGGVALDAGAGAFTEMVMEPLASGTMTVASDWLFEVLEIPNGQRRTMGEAFEEIKHTWSDWRQVTGLIVFSSMMSGANLPQVYANAKSFERNENFHKSMGLGEHLEDIMTAKSPLDRAREIYQKELEENPAALLQKQREAGRELQEAGVSLFLTGAEGENELFRQAFGTAYAEMQARYGLPNVVKNEDGTFTVTETTEDGTGKKQRVMSAENADAYLLLRIQEAEKSYFATHKQGVIAEGITEHADELAAEAITQQLEAEGKSEGIEVVDITKGMPAPIAKRVKAQGAVKKADIEELAETVGGRWKPLAEAFGERVLMGVRESREATAETGTALYRQRRKSPFRSHLGRGLFGSTLNTLRGAANTREVLEDVTEHFTDQAIQVRTAELMAQDAELSEEAAENQALDEMAADVKAARAALLAIEPKANITEVDRNSPLSIIEALSDMGVARGISSTALPSWVAEVQAQVMQNVEAAADVVTLSRAYKQAQKDGVEGLQPLESLLSGINSQMQEMLRDTRLSEQAIQTVAHQRALRHGAVVRGEVAPSVTDIEQQQQADIAADEAIDEQQAQRKPMTPEEVKREEAETSQRFNENMGSSAPSKMKGVFVGDACCYNDAGGYFMGCVSVSSLQLSDEVQQVKAGVKDKKGVINPLVGEFIHDTEAIFVWKRKDGRLEVISGRHKLAHAQANGVAAVTCYVYEENATHNAKWARLLDFENNLRCDQADELTAATYAKETGYDDATLMQRGLLRNKSKSKRGILIGREARPELWTRFKNGVINAMDAEMACMLTKNIRDKKRVDDIQTRICMLLEQGKSWDFIGAMVQLMASKQSIFMKQGLLDLGADFEADLERAANYISKNIAALNDAINVIKSGRKLSGKKKELATRLGQLTASSMESEMMLMDLVSLKEMFGAVGMHPELVAAAQMWDGKTELDPVGMAMEHGRKQREAINEQMQSSEDAELERAKQAAAAAVPEFSFSVREAMRKYGISDFDVVRPINIAFTREEATKALRGERDKVNRLNGVFAKGLNIPFFITRASIGKLPSGAALQDTRSNIMSKDADYDKLHFLAAANIVELWEKSAHEDKHKNTKKDAKTDWVYRRKAFLYANGNLYQIRLTGYTYAQKSGTDHIYTMQVEDVEKINELGDKFSANTTHKEKLQLTNQAQLDTSIPEESVKQNDENISLSVRRVAPNDKNGKRSFNLPTYNERDLASVEKIYGRANPSLDDVLGVWDEVLGYATSGGLSKDDKSVFLPVSPTPAVLQMLGVNPRMMAITPAVVDKITKDKHQVSTEQLRDLPRQLGDPVAIFDSQSHPDSFVILTTLTEMTKMGKRPVIAAVHIDKTSNVRRVRIHRLASMYGRTSNKAFEVSAPLYIKKSFLREDNGSWLQLPSTEIKLKESSTRKVLDEHDLVKYKEKQGLSFSARRVEQSRLLFTQRVGEKESERLIKEFDALIEGWNVVLARGKHDEETLGTGAERYARIRSLIEAARMVLPPELAQMGRMRLLLEWVELYSQMAESGEIPITGGKLKGPIVQKFLASLEKKRHEGLLIGQSEAEVSGFIAEMAAQRIDDAFYKVAMGVRKQLDRYVHAQGLARFELLIERAFPKREGGRKPKLGKMDAESYKSLAAIISAANMTREQLDEAISEKRAAAAGIDPEYERAEELQEGLDNELRILTAFGDVRNMTAPQMKQAVDLLSEFMRDSKLRWQAVLETNKKRAMQHRINISENFKKVNNANTRSQTRKDMLKVGKNLLNAPRLIMSFSQFLRSANKMLGKPFVKREVRALADANANLSLDNLGHRNWYQALTESLAKQAGMSGEAWLNSLAKRQDTGIKLSPMTRKHYSLDWVEAQRWYNMSPAEREMQRAKMREESESREMETDDMPLESAMQALGEAIMKRRLAMNKATPIEGEQAKIHFSLWVNKNDPHNLECTKEAALNSILLFEQPDYYHLIQSEGIAEIFTEAGEFKPEYMTDGEFDYRKALAPLYQFVGAQALQLAYAMRERVNKNGLRMVAKYNEIEGFPMATKERYWRGNFDINSIKDKEAFSDNVGGNAGKPQGMFIERVRHVSNIDWAAPASLMYFQTVGEQDNYFHTSHIVKELRGLMLDNHFSKWLEVEKGTQFVSIMNTWLNIIEGSATLDNAGFQGLGKVQQAMARGVSSAALSGNGFVLAKQSSAIIHALVGGEIPAGVLETSKGVRQLTYKRIGFHEFGAAMARVKAGQGAISMKDLRDSVYFQARVTEWKSRGSAHGFMFDEQKTSLKASYLADAGFAAMGGLDYEFNLHGMHALADAAYRAHKRIAKEKGLDLTDAEMKEEALRVVGECLEVGAQPMRSSQKAYMAARSQMLGKLLMMFRSEAFNKLGAALSDLYDGRYAADFQNFGSVGVFNLVVSELLSYLRFGSSDDERLSEEEQNWNRLVKYALVASVGQFASLPVFGDLVSEGIGKLSGQRYYKNAISPIGLGSLVSSAEKAFTGEDWRGNELESTERALAVIRLLQQATPIFAMGYGSASQLASTASAIALSAATAGNVLRTAVDSYAGVERIREED